MNLIRCLLVVCSMALAGELPWHQNMPEALKVSRASSKPMVVDFSAPWCYSCYYMDQHVLNTDAFKAASRSLVLLRVDVDSVEGHALKAKYQVNALPSYVVISSSGDVLGRIIGEQTLSDFLNQLDRLVKATVPREPKNAVEILKRRLAAAEHDRAKALDALRQLLVLESSCDLAYDISDGAKLLDGLSKEERFSILTLERKALERLVSQKGLVPATQRCADFRITIETLADVYDGLALEDKKTKLFEDTISLLDQDGLKVGQDRNHDDNLRYFLELAKADSRLRLLYPKLIAAYSSDYVYAHRYAKYLYEQKDPAQALPLAEKASQLCYGANCVAVAKMRAKILIDLNRKSDAVQVLRESIAKNKKEFPKESESLKTLLAALAR